MKGKLRWATLCLLILSLVCAYTGATAAFVPPPAAALQANQPSSIKPQLQTRGAKQSRPNQRVQPVNVIHNPQPDVLTGEAQVSADANQNPLIRIGMAQNGVTLIEIPASDRFFTVNPGNQDLVTVEDSPTKKTDHYMVLRVGDGFIVPQPPATYTRTRDGRTVRVARAVRQQMAVPTTSIITQMRSGMVITFLVYPVKSVSEQAHRVVIRYEREAVVAARMAAGLAVNLGETDARETRPADQVAESNEAKNSSVIVPASLPLPAPPQEEGPARQKAENKEEAAAPTQETSAIGEVERKPERRPEAVANLRHSAKKALDRALTNLKQFKSWSKPVHGLSLSTLRPQDMSSGGGNNHTRVVIVAVRNTLLDSLRIAPGHPGLYLETLGDTGKPVQVETLRVLALETTAAAAGASLPAGCTIYYAIVYPTPLLGAKQQLGVVVAQTNAADEPAKANLTASVR